MCEPKAGTLVGTDYSGNKYFENNREQAGRNRWVDYAQVSCLSLEMGFDRKSCLEGVEQQQQTIRQFK